MSEDHQAKNEEKESSRRRRRPRVRKPKTDKPQETPENTTEKEQKKERVKKERVTYSWPAESLGTSHTGNVFAVYRKARFIFGFITLSTAEDALVGNYPRVYFNRSHIKDENLMLRRGYQVQFIAENDENGRSVGNNIQLTEAGEKTKVEREAALAAKLLEQKQEAPKASAATKTEGSESKPKSSRRKRSTKGAEGGEAAKEKKATADEGEKEEKKKTRERKPKEVKNVKLNVTCEGHSQTLNVVANVNQNIGVLRRNLLVSFGAPDNYGIYHKDEFLRRSTYHALVDDDTIHLAPRKEA